MALTSLTWDLHLHIWSMGAGTPFKLRPGQVITLCLSYIIDVLVLSPGSSHVSCLIPWLLDESQACLQTSFGPYLLRFLACLSGWTLDLLCGLAVTVDGACSQHPALPVLPVRMLPVLWSPLAPGSSHLRKQRCPVCLLAEIKMTHWKGIEICSGVAGCCAKTTTAPLDRVKILLQAHNHHYKHLGVFSTLCAVPKKEGYLGLYKGNGAMMIRIFPYGAIQFMAFDQYKKVIKKQLGISGHVHRLMAGSMAGITAVICTYPLDMVRVRLAFQVKGEHKYMGIIHAFKMIYTKEGGFRGFYRGLMPTVVGMAPYAGKLQTERGSLSAIMCVTKFT
ncbi:hypothetical protein llap_15489 [Limosa lapponica baueri]|uniref:Graves disease carrier protein n=1 Tax=Limosa lapponica baueri TaxID=1758121 RepID=A0A2I0TK94_LIMLA|nr:hypothetical protein llap_15489 [Limosa lapponica baueri]